MPNLILRPRPVEEVQFRAGRMQKLYLDQVETKVIHPGAWPQLTEEENSFVRSELILSRLDFRYWADRYGTRQIEAGQGGGQGTSEFWPSQERALELIASREEECQRELARSGITEGIQGVWNKTRQQGATALLRLIIGHRITTRKHTRVISAGLDDEKVGILFTRDHIWLDNLPFYMKPQVLYEEKNAHFKFDNDLGTGMKSSILYQTASQKTGIGVGDQFDMAHFTELSKWGDGGSGDNSAWRLEGDFMPTRPKAPTTFIGWESTPWGRGPGNFWYVYSEAVRQRKPGFESWIYVFTPHYINSNLNRLPAPEGWNPSPVTLEHYDLVERTSPEWTGGRTVRMTLDQMFWWESKYLAAEEQDQLHVFFTDYPATPEQGFQHHERSAFSVKTLDWLNSCTGRGIPYEVRVNARHVEDDFQEIQIPTIPEDRAPSAFHVGKLGSLVRMSGEELDSDPRGIFWIWELPKRSASYLMGMDITQGKTGWSRYSRTRADLRTDNGTIEIIRRGKGKASGCGCPGCRSLARGNPDFPMPDHLVAEYAAPVDPEELGYVANILGRVYAGNEGDQCKCIMEVHPGPGKTTMKKMLDLGYRNQWLWIRYADMVGAQTQQPGWSASRQSNQDLWVCASRHITLKNLVSFSPFFVEECSDAIYNPQKGYAENTSGHDDRLRAGFLALWAAYPWGTGMGERTREVVSTTAPALDPQSSDMSPAEIGEWYQRAWDRAEELMEGR